MSAAATPPGPRPLGGSGSSFGFGDRLGLATPGHVEALRASGVRLFPVLAQQSARELERTGRSFADVLDAARRGAAQAGWTAGYGADADHLRTEEEVEAAVAAGFTMLTLDPSAHVDAAAAQAEGADLERRVRALPWDGLADGWGSMRRRHAAAAPELELARAAAVYGRALVHTAALARAAGRLSPGSLDVEVSIDETDLPTSAFAHAFVATELRRLGVGFTGLAPRFPGSWQKGIDLHGDLGEVAAAFADHARVARELGGYRISVHSGSDKLSAYPLLAVHDDVGWHVKTSGTSYLEGLRVVATAEPDLFREVLAVAGARLETDRRSYAIAATAGVPEPAALLDADLPALLDDDDARQCLHVTFGSVLSDERLAGGVRRVLETSADAYADALVAHFRRHLEPLAGLA